MIIASWSSPKAATRYTARKTKTSFLGNAVKDVLQVPEHASPNNCSDRSIMLAGRMRQPPLAHPGSQFRHVVQV